MVKSAAVKKKTTVSKNELKYPITKKQYEELYRLLVTTRFHEDKLPILYRQGKIYGGVYRGTGHEAISVGTAYALGPQDIVAPIHRDVGAHITKGQEVRRIFANYMGKEAGPSRGRDGNIHHGNIDINIIGNISHLGSSIPVAVGAAIAKRMQGENVVSMSYIGDGGTSLGDFHEGMNFAAVQNVPYIMVVENNQYAYSTPNDLQFKCENLVDRAVGYGILGLTAFGPDIIDVYQKAKEAVEHARAGKGPVLLVCETMRFHGHSEHDNHAYVPQSLYDYWNQYDPVDVYRKYLKKHKILTTAQIAKIDEEIHQFIDDAADWADKQPVPDPAKLLDGVYCEEEAE